jgi:hypothetical protein
MAARGGWGAPPQQDPYGGRDPADVAAGNDNTASAALLVSIASVILMCFPIGIVSLIMAATARQRIHATGGTPHALRQTTLAIVLSCASLLLTVLLAVGGWIFWQSGRV